MAHEQEQEKRCALIFILAVGLLLIVVFAFVKKEKQAVLLSQKNEQINKALGDNKMWPKQLHYRVKNFLIGSSLLELQSKGRCKGKRAC